MTDDTNISNISDDSGKGDAIITEKGEAISRKFFLKRRNIGISISVSDNISELGYGIPHLNDAMIEIARYIVSLGGTLTYGGDMRTGGFTELIFDLLAYYKADKEFQPNERFYSYLAYPISETLSDQKEAELIQNVSFKKITAPSDFEIVTADDLFKNTTPANLYVWTRCLTKMREEMESTCDARIFIGGAMKKFKGKCPGVLEELMIAINHHHPIYLIGAFGGITKEAIEVLKGNPSEYFSDELHFENIEYKNMVKLYNEKHTDQIIDYKKYLSLLQRLGMKGIANLNGLSEDDNFRLTVTPHISEIVYLILKGLTNRFTK
ncbi:MAG: hypothetical protein ACKVOK_10310 [Flavobacteriales bacterium]